MININPENAWNLFYKTGMPTAYMLYKKAENITNMETAEEIDVDIKKEKYGGQKTD